VPRGVAATANEDTTIRLYDAATWQPLREIRSSYTTPRALAFSLDGRQLFAGGVDGLVKRYDPQNGTELTPLKPAGLVTDLLALPGGKSLAVQTEAIVAVPPATWEIIDLETGRSRPCAPDRAADGLAVVDGEVWCFDVQGETVDAWTLR
jgi:WD40 repeat protein